MYPKGQQLHNHTYSKIQLKKQRKVVIFRARRGTMAGSSPKSLAFIKNRWKKPIPYSKWSLVVNIKKLPWWQNSYSFQKNVIIDNINVENARRALELGDHYMAWIMLMLLWCVLISKLIQLYTLNMWKLVCINTLYVWQLYVNKVFLKTYIESPIYIHIYM